MNRAPDKLVEMLLVEDSPMDVILTQEALKSIHTPHRLHIARTGSEATTFISETTQGGVVPDLILLDLNLPGRDGREILADLRRTVELRHTPVIILTTSNSARDLLTTVEQDVVSHLTKPFDVNEFIGLVHSVVNALLPGILDAKMNRTPPAATAVPRPDEPPFELIVENLNDGILILDSTGIIRFANPAAEALLGKRRNELIGQWFALPALTQRQEEIEVFDADGRKRIMEARLSRLEWKGKPATLASLRDTTERKATEEERQRTADRLAARQKIQSLGTLAGGVAHDFNNLLMSIMGNITLAKRHLPPDNELSYPLNEAERSCEKARDLTWQFLHMSREGEPIRTTLNMAQILDETAAIAFSGSNIVCEQQTPPDLWETQADDSQVRQLVSNLLANAREAMPDGGTVQLKAENVHIDRRSALPLPAGRYVRVAVHDSGAGIPEQDLARVFDPLFTTKAGRFGCGLAIAASIAYRHDGCIQADSVPGQGATFTFYLPAAETGHDRAGAATRAPATTGPRPVRHAGATCALKVLFMDDEPSLREVVGCMLQACGHTATTCCDGLAAVTTYRSAIDTGTPFDLVILDLTVRGGMGGKQALQELRKINPNVRALVSSGYTEDPVFSRFRDFGFHGTVRKPYNLEQLKTAITEAINAPEIKELKP